MEMRTLFQGNVFVDHQNNTYVLSDYYDMQ